MRLEAFDTQGSSNMMNKSLSTTKVMLAAILASAVLTCQAKDLPTIGSVQGIYKYSFPNALMDSTQYTSENRLLLMSTSLTTAYFDVHLEWANGHSCDLSGIADVMSEQVLTYSTPSIMEKTCTFNITLDTNKFVLNDENRECRIISCGSRGMLDGVEFEYDTVEKITPATIKETPSFIRAMSEYKTEDTAVSE
jgi:hypothetical protein